MPTPRPYPSKSTQSEPDVFIIESLAMSEEVKEAFEGRALRDNLRTIGYRPQYHYVRTASELKVAFELFRHSKYRFLHLSIHGTTEGVTTTLESLTNDEFAELTKKKLPNRRLFISACEAGAGSLVNKIQEQNKGIESIAAPLDEIDLRKALAFWTAFYTKVLVDSPLKFKASDLKKALAPLCEFFGIRLNWSYWNPNTQQWNSFLVK